MIKLALADDQVMFRRGLVMLLRDMPDAQVVFECSNGEELLTGLKGNAIDIVLLDLEMPVLNGMDTMKRLRAEHPDVKVIVLSMHGEEKFIVHLMELGANGYVLKTAEPDEIENAVRSVSTSGYHFSEMVSRVMLHGLVKKEKIKPTFSDVEPLTERELDVLRLICQELTTTEIAGKLFLSPRTVEGYRNNILQKIGARNTAGIVVYAMSKGLYTP
ncbi:MAG: response regulator transcription factor [Flavobacteriales bacterium]|jgi:DNA-binding NarL/FixJ family response regulator|nr:response regulator transcription factor [Flavobacteriales bacterium]MBK6753772.1 response regulator transcription factor [Flavobacteriales bacterium]MBK7086530.1 response regulator transcription factor [Flavobacteriales bacterium]MBK7268257.1 response regulator transcription factor [Flavobacteriales bacterium]MBK9073429.1 response regulator transcription factor [Flavobacteriales bacterium]